jgi:Rrf2 family protein
MVLLTQLVNDSEEVKMLRINRRTDYAVRVMLALAKRPEAARISTKTIQEEMLVPRAFLQRIIADLSKKGLLHTFPGPHGGLQLARPSQAITLRDIYEAIEGPLLISECLAPAGKCPLDGGCPVHPHWRRLQILLVGELEAITLEQLALDAHVLARPGVAAQV